MLSQNDIQQIANLARIKFTEEEGKKFSKDLSSILDFISQLKEVEGEVSDERLRERGVFNVLREDVDDNKELEGMVSNLVDMAPEKQNGYVKVKKII